MEPQSDAAVSDKLMPEPQLEASPSEQEIAAIHSPDDSPTVDGDTLEPLEAIFFPPEVLTEAEANALAKVREGCGVSDPDKRLFFMAIKQRKNGHAIPRAMMDAVTYDAYMSTRDPSVDARLKARVREGLMRIELASKPKGLPEQMVLNVNNSLTMNVPDTMKALEGIPGYLDSLDFREFKPERGSADDYAE